MPDTTVWKKELKYCTMMLNQRKSGGKRRQTYIEKSETDWKRGTGVGALRLLLSARI